MIRDTNISPQQHMTTLVSNMLSGTYTTEKIIELFNEYPLEILSSEQLAGCLDGVIKNAAFHIDSSAYDKPLVIPAGTGGDMQSTVNITTMAGFVIAASESCIVPLYGNRSASGKFGKMDVLEALSIPIERDKTQIDHLLHTIGIAPVFARSIYPGAKHIAQARKLIGKPTFFNIVMPLAAPIIGDTRLLLGVGNDDYLSTMAEILQTRGTKKSLLVHNNSNGMDELSFGKNHIATITQKSISSEIIDMEAFTIKSESIELLQATTPEEFVTLFQQVLNPEYTSQKINAIRTVVAMNAACGLYLASNTTEPFKKEFLTYYHQALNLLKTGKACKVLQKLQQNK